MPQPPSGPVDLTKVSIRSIAGLLIEDVTELQQLGNLGSLAALAAALAAQNGDMTHFSTNDIVIEEVQSERIGTCVILHLRRNHPNHATTKLFEDWPVDESFVQPGEQPISPTPPQDKGLLHKIFTYFD